MGTVPLEWRTGAAALKSLERVAARWELSRTGSRRHTQAQSSLLRLRDQWLQRPPCGLAPLLALAAVAAISAALLLPEHALAAKVSGWLDRVRALGAAKSDVGTRLWIWRYLAEGGGALHRASAGGAEPLMAYIALRGTLSPMSFVDHEASVWSAIWKKNTTRPHPIICALRVEVLS